MPRLRPSAAALAPAALFLTTAACDTSPTAPDAPLACFRMSGPETSPRFQIVAGGVKNLESCAAALEAVSLRERRPELTGAYQGQFIFITPDMVQSSLRLDGARYRLFDAATRGKIDHNLNWMLEDERHPSDFAPRTSSARSGRGGSR